MLVTGATRRTLRWAAAAVAVAAGALTLSPIAAAAPSRVVTLTPFTANTVASLGVTPVAVGEILGGDERFSRRLNGVRRLSLSHPNGPNLEQLAVLNPQLVLSAPIWARGEAGMRSLRINVQRSEPQRVAQVPAETRRIGAMLGRSRQAEAIARSQQRAIASATRNVTRRPRVLVILGVGNKPYAFLPESWGGDLVTRAGGRLLTAGIRGSGGFAHISNELVVRRNPDVIIAVPHGARTEIPRLRDQLRNNPAWRSTNAVKRGRLYVVTDDSLLQPWTNVAQAIRTVRAQYLRNL